MKMSENSRGLQSIQTLIRILFKTLINEGDVVVDATAGRGRDTLFLAECVGPSGLVYAFDIQIEAINSTTELLGKHQLLDRVRLVHGDHSRLMSEIRGPIKAAMFNLGYMPSGDHQITTKPNTTVRAVHEALKQLTIKGVLAATVYQGHQGSTNEAEALVHYVEALPKKSYSVLQGSYINQAKSAPYWIMIQKNWGDSP